MTSIDKSIPVLPSRSLPRTITFYEKLGFSGLLLASGTYAILSRGDLELHFFPHPELKPEACYAACYMRVADVDALHSAFASAGLPTQGIPRMEGVENKPWMMREFALVDENGNLAKFGQVM
ncbi:bleomycin resistance protein [Paucibacter sp. Y2R2-4]|uniref:bleomycin resistance protein n=1 Tax=Paucibacter sp. Y2R2-4 TaxID=2893553 RepID=UPI0021E4172D|nr:VOC family protein [Paucibacter sp. Y2R2-4]MCV2351217.1 VOC family protein [Paucibacter sp. Y2R2-4]